MPTCYLRLWLYNLWLVFGNCVRFSTVSSVMVYSLSSTWTRISATCVSWIFWVDFSPSCDTVFLYSGKPSGSRREWVVGLLLTATAGLLLPEDQSLTVSQLCTTTHQLCWQWHRKWPLSDGTYLGLRVFIFSVFVHIPAGRYKAWLTSKTWRRIDECSDLKSWKLCRWLKATVNAISCQISRQCTPCQKKFHHCISERTWSCHT